MKIRRKNTNPFYSFQSSSIWSNKGFKKLIYRNYNKIFHIFQKLGIHVTPNHFYFPIPDTRMLTDEVFKHQTELIGIDMDEKEQLELLSIFESNYKKELDSFPRYKTKIPYQYYTTNGNFNSVDGDILYCMIRHFKPKNIIEIGSGNSTYCSAQAIRKNKEIDRNYECEFTAIEPYPNKILKKGFPGLSKLIPTKLQEVPLETFMKLKENDILFIDSSHVLYIGNDVQYEYLEILPRVNKGVIIHIHDIFLPKEYPPVWIYNLFRFYNEQYLLQAFLTLNNKFKVIWAAKYMHLKQEEKLKKVFKSFEKDISEINSKSLKKVDEWPIEWPSSFWIKRIN